MRILCNLPLECFDHRSTFTPVDLITYGPGHRMVVDGRHYPPDVEFDPAEGSIEELFALLPAGWRPDLVLIWWPDQDPLPAGLERCPVPVVAVVSDYNLTLPYTAPLWPFFDVVLVDRSGIDIFRRLSFPDVRPFVQFSFKAVDHHPYPEIARRTDIGFAGNLNPVVQGERNVWIRRLLKVRESGVAVDIRSGIFGADYGRFLASVKLGFNRSIRGEMNLRAFEVPACGALLMMERENLEVREFFTPGAECVLYGDDDFEDLVRDLLADPGQTARIAEAGHRRVQSYRMGERLRTMLEVLRTPGPGRPPSTPFDRALGRGTAMLATWTRGPGILRCLTEAARLAPDDPRPWNALGVALLRHDPRSYALQALGLFRKACRLSGSYVPAAVNAALLLANSTPDPLVESHFKLATYGPGQPLQWADLDGPILPGVFSAESISLSHGLAAALRAGHPAPLAAAMLAC